MHFLLYAPTPIYILLYKHKIDLSFLARVLWPLTAALLHLPHFILLLASLGLRLTLHSPYSIASASWIILEGHFPTVLDWLHSTWPSHKSLIPLTFLNSWSYAFAGHVCFSHDQIRSIQESAETFSYSLQDLSKLLIIGWHSVA